MKDSKQDSELEYNALYVDDDVGMLEVVPEMVSILEPSIKMHTEQTPEAALNYVERNPIDVILSDYDMPRMNGLEFYEELEEEIPFIIYTGSRRKDIKNSAENKVDHIIWKEVREDHYEEIADKLLEYAEPQNTEKSLN